MSWAATGQIVDSIDAEGLEWDRPYDTLSDVDKAQADFMIDVVARGFTDGILSGSYQVNLQGSTDANAMPEHGEGGGRQHIYLDLIPT